MAQVRHFGSVFAYLPAFNPLLGRDVSLCAGFRTPAWREYPRADAAGVAGDSTASEHEVTEQIAAFARLEKRHDESDAAAFSRSTP